SRAARMRASSLATGTIFAFSTRLAKAIACGKDEQGMGVHTTRLASLSTSAAAEETKIVPLAKLEARILAALEKARVPMRTGPATDAKPPEVPAGGDITKLADAVKEILEKDEAASKFSSRIPAWA